MNQSELKNVMETLKRLLKIGRGLAALTRTDMDDKVLEKLDEILTVVEPFLEDEMLVDLLNWILELFKKESPKVALEKLKAKV